MSLVISLFAVCASAGQVVAGPGLEVSLDSHEASPVLAEAIAHYEAGRGSSEALASAGDLRAFNAELLAAKPRLEGVAKQLAKSLLFAGDRGAKAVAFFAKGAAAHRSRSGEETVAVEVVDSSQLDASVAVAGAHGVEVAAIGREEQEMGAWHADFARLTDFVVQEATGLSLAAPSGQGRSSTSFLKGNAAASAGPSSAAIVDMEARRGLGDSLRRAKHLSLAMALLHRENAILKVALRQELAAAQASGVGFLSASVSGASAAAPEQFVFDIAPPQEDEHDSLAAIDGVLSAEKARQGAVNAAFSDGKVRMLEAEKTEIRRSSR